jgi:hypothetical protein
MYFLSMLEEEHLGHASSALNLKMDTPTMKSRGVGQHNNRLWSRNQETSFTKHAPRLSVARSEIMGPESMFFPYPRRFVVVETSENMK